MALVKENAQHKRTISDLLQHQGDLLKRNYDLTLQVTKLMVANRNLQGNLQTSRPSSLQPPAPVAVISRPQLVPQTRVKLAKENVAPPPLLLQPPKKLATLLATKSTVAAIQAQKGKRGQLKPPPRVMLRQHLLQKRLPGVDSAFIGGEMVRNSFSFLTLSLSLSQVVSLSPEWLIFQLGITFWRH